VPTRTHRLPDDVIPRAEKAVAHPPTWVFTNCWRQGEELPVRVDDLV